MNMPVLFLVFNRPEPTKKVFEQIRKARPPRLYVAADGPRKDRANEAAKCEAVRSIATNVDWNCEVKTLFREENLGCKVAVSGGIDWFFENEEMGIILEDDCLPNESFFRYCEELLIKYKHDDRIFLISGHNKQDKWNPEKYDYFFSNLGGIWGWASWGRAWEHYDIEMKKLQEFIDRDHFVNLLGETVGNKRKKDILNAPDTTWDYQWGFARHLNSGLSCVPSKNLIQNIGFGEEATHTVESGKKTELHDLNFPLKENEFVVADTRYDKLFLGESSIINKLMKKFSTLVANVKIFLQ